MSLQDRVAFACTYLDDRQLCAHIAQLTQQVAQRGDINGLFLTGLPNEGISLLTNYVNTVSLTMVPLCSARSLLDRRVSD